jgi:hypothetical protein
MLRRGTSQKNARQGAAEVQQCAIGAMPARYASVVYSTGGDRGAPDFEDRWLETIMDTSKIRAENELCRRLEMRSLSHP